MSDLARWSIGLGGIAVLSIILHFVAGFFSPRREGDPRLGILGFWVWVAITGAFVYFVFEPLDSTVDLAPLRRLRIALLGVCALLWFAEKTGHLDWPDWLRESQADHEEAWATVVGIFIGLLVLPAALALLSR